MKYTLSTIQMVISSLDSQDNSLHQLIVNRRVWIRFVIGRSKTIAKLSDVTKSALYYIYLYLCLCIPAVTNCQTYHGNLLAIIQFQVGNSCHVDKSRGWRGKGSGTELDI